MQMEKITINDGWHGLWYRIGAQARNAWEVFLGTIVKHYCEPHRYYHNFSHLIQLFNEFKEVRHLCVNPDAVEMFLWLHDLIYLIGANDNEEQSAEASEKILMNARLSEEISRIFIPEVKRLVLLSKDHLAAPNDIDGALAMDLDLSILGQPIDVFDAFEYKIWQENVLGGDMAEEAFRTRREDILRKFLDRTPIYQTPYFREKYEKTARANLERSLRQLQIAA